MKRTLLIHWKTALVAALLLTGLRAASFAQAPGPAAGKAGEARLAATWTIDAAEVHQEIDGFGAATAFTGQDLTDEQADLFFSAKNGIGLSLVRNRVGPQNQAATAMTTWELAALRKAVQRGAVVWSSPWSPPAPWKSNHATTGGGELLPSRYADYADSLARYVADMRDQGVPLAAISLQNEPDLATTYESCRWSGQQIHDFLPYLARALEAYGVAATRTILPEESNWRITLAQETMADPATASAVGMLAAHGYDPAPVAVPRFGRKIWQTETSELHTAYSGSLPDALTWAERIHRYLVEQEVSAWHWWWLFPFADDNSGLVAKDGSVPLRLWALGQFSRFIRPGYVRIGCAGTGKPLVSAYKEPGSGRFVIVAINLEKAPVDVTFVLQNKNPRVVAVTPWTTSATDSLAPGAQVPIQDGRTSYTLPSRSITTFVSVGPRGDVDQDGAVEEDDPFLLSRGLAEDGAAPPGGWADADLDQDGLVTAVDLVCLLRSAGGR